MALLSNQMVLRSILIRCGSSLFLGVENTDGENILTQADANKFTKTPPDAEQPRSFVQCLSGTCQNHRTFRKVDLVFQKFMGKSQNII